MVGKSVRSTIFIQAELLQFSQDEIRKMIPVNIMQELKEKDPNPYISMYSMIHEGTTRPKQMGSKEQKPITWYRQAIQSIKNIVLKGIKFFKGHNTTNSNQDKEVMGEVIYNKEMEIEGKLHHIIFGYHPKEKLEEVKKLPACSHEGLWNLFESATEKIADSIENITGIALTDGTYQKPAFPGSLRLGELQCFSVENPLDNGMEEKMEITFADVKEFIISRGIVPSRIYELEDVKQDRKFSAVFTDLEEKAKAIENEKIKLSDDNKKLADQLKQLESDSIKLTAKSRLTGLTKELTENQKSFVINSFDDDMKDNFIEDFSDEGLQKYIKIQTKAYARAVGENSEIPPQIQKTDNLNSDDFSKKDNNPFLIEDVDLSVIGE